MRNTIIAVVVTLVIAGGGGFYGGMQYQKNQAPTGFPGAGNFQNLSEAGVGPRGGNFGSRNGGVMPEQSSFSVGEVVSVDTSNLVIKLPNDSGTKIVFYSDSTEISKQASGSIADIAAGDTITVMGDGNDDGSMTADSIQLVPAQQ